MELGIQFFAGDYPAALLASLAVIWRIAGWPSAIKEHWLLGNLASSDNSIRCIAVSMRCSEWASQQDFVRCENQTQLLFLALAFEFGESELMNGSSRL